MKKKKERRTHRFASYTLIVLVVGSICLYFFYQPVLLEAGKFLAPDGMAKAKEGSHAYDVVILENGESVAEDPVKIGIKIISSGKANRLVVVYQNKQNKRILGRAANFDHFLIREMEGLGLRRDQIKVIAVPEDHPVTLTEARIVLSDLSKDGIGSAILLVEGFHTRRSYWVYKQVGAPLGIRVISHPYFLTFRKESWWQEANGVRDFVGEGGKLLYYIFRGYIPIKSLFVT
jgi:hypothetical protein